MKKPLRMQHLAYKTIGQETIILDTQIGKEVHQLNEVASFIWNLCDGEHNLQNIIDLVCEEFEIDATTASSDVSNLISELQSKSLLSDHSI